MDNNYNASGSTTIASDVLVTITQLTTLNIEGVSRLSLPRAPGMSRILKPSHIKQGIYIDVIDDMVYADIYVALHNDVNVRDVSHQIQREVARAISEMVGMQVGRINIHIEDIDYSSEAETKF